MPNLIVQLTDPAALDAARFGPKAANQAALGQAGLPIPAGFAVAAAAYRAQLAALGLDEAAQLAAGRDRRAARKHISAVRIGLFDQPITAAVREPLVAAWRKLVAATGAPTVVRSSALLEDTAGSTFAGQFESFLGLASEAEMLTAVRACWAALWSSRALRYMEGRAISVRDSAMGLLVQPLINARTAGGGMSLTADGGMLISATWGLGSAIAQGEVAPDRYDLDANGRVQDVVTGRKHHSVHCVHHPGAAAAVAVAQDKAVEACLDAARIEQLGGLLRRAAQVIGGPVEIEWAEDAGGFKLLQARPLQMQATQVPDQIWLRHPALKGHPSGIGWGAGRAVVINCECELGRVGPGDILVTKVAGPALGQVLPRVAGVVAELGGSTSHLASLARERGIPMVLGVMEATHKIPDGARVGIDGVMGLVRWIGP